jgi:trimeric autotransporter adhesin
MKKLILIVSILLFVFTNTVFAQKKKLGDKKEKRTTIKTMTAIEGKMSVKDNSDNVLIEVNDEGTKGSITISEFGVGQAPSSSSGKLYNVNGALYWSGSALGTSSSAGGWTDGGTNVYLSMTTDNVGIGDSSPTNKLDVAGKIGINDTQLIYFPGGNFTGTLYLGDGGSSLSYTAGDQGKYNTAVGIGALNANTTGHRNSANGYYALYSNTTGNMNTASGHEALYSNSTGGANTASGDKALYSNTAGSYNTASGRYALIYNTTGNSNTASGDGALHMNTTGNYNVGVGKDANYYTVAGSNNTIVGYQAGRGTTGNDKSGNVFIGYQAGYNETGSNKLYIENSNSASPLIGGDFTVNEVYFNGDVGIGTTTPVSELEVNGRLELPDNDATPTAGSGAIEISNQLRIDKNEIITNTGVTLYLQLDNGGDLQVDNGTLLVDASENRVGIGTNTPSSKLDVYDGTLSVTHVASTTDEDVIKIGVDGEYSASIKLYDDDGEADQHFKMTFDAETQDLRFHSDGTDNILYLTENGSVGIGTATPNTKLAVLGLPGTGTAFNHLLVNPSTGDFYYGSSSKRYKEDIQDFKENFSKILEVKPKKYKDKASGQQEIGYIAEEFEEIGLNDLVIYNEEKKPNGLKYDRVSLYLVEVIKEQQKKISELEERIKNLEK